MEQVPSIAEKSDEKEGDKERNKKFLNHTTNVKFTGLF